MEQGTGRTHPHAWFGFGWEDNHSVQIAGSQIVFSLKVRKLILICTDRRSCINYTEYDQPLHALVGGY